MTENIGAEKSAIEMLVETLRIKFKDRLIMIGYPSGDLVPVEFVTSLIELVMQNAPIVSLGLNNMMSSRIAKNRNAIVENARLLNATDILWIDSDSKFPTNALLRLLAHDKDIVGATTCSRVGNDRSPQCEPMDIDSLQPNQQLVKMNSMGFPFMLTKMSVFDKIRKPYFAEPPIWMVTDQPDSTDILGEDVYFCVSARMAGFDIWCDMNLSMEIGHIGKKIYYVEQKKSFSVPMNENIEIEKNDFMDNPVMNIGA